MQIFMVSGCRVGWRILAHAARAAAFGLARARMATGRSAGSRAWAFDAPVVDGDGGNALSGAFRIMSRSAFGNDLVAASQ
jgi:hypothetical protein